MTGFEYSYFTYLILPPIIAVIGASALIYLFVYKYKISKLWLERIDWLWYGLAVLSVASIVLELDREQVARTREAEERILVSSAASLEAIIRLEQKNCADEQTAQLEKEYADSVPDDDKMVINPTAPRFGEGDKLKAFGPKLNLAEQCENVAYLYTILRHSLGNRGWPISQLRIVPLDRVSWKREISGFKLVQDESQVGYVFKNWWEVVLRVPHAREPGKIPFLWAFEDLRVPAGKIPSDAGEEFFEDFLEEYESFAQGRTFSIKVAEKYFFPFQIAEAIARIQNTTIKIQDIDKHSINSIDEAINKISHLWPFIFAVAVAFRLTKVAGVINIEKVKKHKNQKKLPRNDHTRPTNNLSGNSDHCRESGQMGFKVLDQAIYCQGTDEHDCHPGVYICLDKLSVIRCPYCSRRFYRPRQKCFSSRSGDAQAAL